MKKALIILVVLMLSGCTKNFAPEVACNVEKDTLMVENAELKSQLHEYQVNVKQKVSIEVQAKESELNVSIKS